MYKYEVGQIIPAFMGHAENVYFNMDNGGAITNDERNRTI